MAEKPIFIDSDPTAVVDALINDYQAITGRSLQDAQVERLLINSIAYSIALHKNQVNEAALQCLVAFATAPALDRLGDLVGVKRLAASQALVTLEFSLVAGHSGVVVPAGTRVASLDGQAIFETSEALEVAIGINTAEVQATAQQAGAAGNGFIAGTISELLDPQPFVASVANTTTSAGGADLETDDGLRERIQLAPASFSNAGSVGAYEFFAKTASQLIADVAITNPVPGTVNIYPMIFGGGTTPPEILAAVLEACNSEKVRPLTDTVQVLSPTTIFYDIEVNIELYTDSTQATVEAEVLANLTAFSQEKGQRLGLDIMLSQIIAQCTGVEEVYDVQVVLPAADIIVGPTQVAICTSITINVTGLNDG